MREVFGRVQRRESLAVGEGRKEKDQNSSSLVLVLKWPQARQGTDGPFLVLRQRSGEREKEKINTIAVRNLKINPKT